MSDIIDIDLKLTEIDLDGAAYIVPVDENFKKLKAAAEALKEGVESSASGNHTHSPEDVGAAEADHTHNPEDVGAAPENHKHSAADVGAAPAYTFGTDDLVAGESALETGKLYFVYE